MHMQWLRFVYLRCDTLLLNRITSALIFPSLPRFHFLNVHVSETLIMINPEQNALNLTLFRLYWFNVI